MAKFVILKDGFRDFTEFATREEAEQYIKDNPILWRLCDYDLRVVEVKEDEDA